jgi:hypothetical protein
MAHMNAVGLDDRAQCFAIGPALGRFGSLVV